MISDSPLLIDTLEISNVVSNGYCVGCGACAVASPGLVTMARNCSGAMEAQINAQGKISIDPDLVCPFSNKANNEDQISENHYPDATNQSNFLGRFENTYIGSVGEGNYRAIGSSGGVTSWILVELMSKGMINAVVHVHAIQNENRSDLFEYRISKSIDEIKNGAKTRYYSVSMDVAIEEIKAEKLNFAFVGVPCFIKAIRSLALYDSALSEQFKFTIAIFCGHMKAAGFAESLAWQVGVLPADIKTVDFRVKFPDRPAPAYGFSAIAKTNGEIHTAPMSSLAGRRWDGGYFKLKACEFCDDVVGETADISLGDAWLPEYSHDSKGTNVVVIRSTDIANIVEEASNNQRLNVEEVPPEKIVQSQAAGFRDRREALKYRLWLADQRNNWRPNKRVQPEADHLTVRRRMIYRFRSFVRQRSFSSFYFSKKIKFLGFYRLEMTFYHGVFRLIGIIESKFPEK